MPYPGRQYADAGEKMPSGIDIPKMDDFTWTCLSDGDKIATDGAKMQVEFLKWHIGHIP